MVEINTLWYKVSKAAVGAVFNVSNVILEVILGIPPLQVVARVIAIKHYLKVFSEEEDIHKRFIISQLMTRNPTVLGHLRDLMKFFSWRTENFCENLNPEDHHIIQSGDIFQLPSIPKQLCKYTKGMIDMFTEHLWQENVKNQLMSEG